MADPWHDGYLARFDDYEQTQNPHDVGTPEHAQWNDGWFEADDEIQQE